MAIQRDQITQIAYFILKYKEDNGILPKTLDELVNYSPECKVVDRWQTLIRYETNGDEFTVTSAGSDRQFGTQQDISAHLDVPNTEGDSKEQRSHI